MAQKITVIEELVDDLDGTEASETLSFGFDGQNYEIDLNDVNAKQLKTTMDTYLKVARKVGAKKAPAKKPASAAVISNPSGVSDATIRANREQNKAIREWGRAQGMNVPSHGRVPEEVREAYNRTHGVQTTAGGKS